MDYALFFEPVDAEKLGLADASADRSLLMNTVLFYNPSAPLDISEAQLAIIGVPESRNS